MNGLIIQWKKNSTSIGTDASQTISLPIEFSNTEYIVIPNTENTNTGADAVFVRVVSKTRTDVTVKTRRNESQSTGTRYVCFIAIGY